jgi:predicted HAD superfamily Cof-like phosphohydrolase
VRAAVDARDRAASRFEGEQLALDLGVLAPIASYVRRVRRRSRPRPQDQVAEFHRVFELPSRPSPGMTGVDSVLRDLRIRLLEEEVAEFREATEAEDIVAVADAIGDILYVAYGAAITYGIDADAVVAEVHRSNMSKLGPDGRPVRRADGKVLKPSSYHPPDIESVLFGRSPTPGT